MKTKKGFTLVELLVVIAILAILATATIVGFTAFTQKAKQSNLEGELKQVSEMLQLEDYYNGNYEILENGDISFRDEHCKEVKDNDVWELQWITAADYANLTLQQKNSWTTPTITLVVKYCSDAELAKYADRLSYEGGVLTLVDDLETGHELKAWWTINSNTIESGKISG